MRYRTLCLLILLATVIQSDPIAFRTILDCDASIAYYCGYMMIYEVDHPTYHDKVKDDYFCTFEKKRDCTFPPMRVGGDGSPTYEFSYILTHNCTTDGKVRCVKPRDLSYAPVNGEHTVEFYAPIFNQGADGECRHPNSQNP
ncbi:unnamed protein product [Caenorhabditis brenneri]